MNQTPPTPRHTGRPVQPLWVRLTHWLNALAVLVLVASGWRIYNAAPFFPFTIPKELTLGGWLGGALQWHFAAMWLLAANGLVYLGRNLFSGRLFRKFFPLTPAGIWHDYMTAALPRLKVQGIPGGDYAPPEPEGGPIDQIIDGVTDFFRGDRDEPPPSEFDDNRRPPPARERERRPEPQY